MHMRSILLNYFFMFKMRFQRLIWNTTHKHSRPCHQKSCDGIRFEDGTKRNCMEVKQLFTWSSVYQGENKNVAWSLLILRYDYGGVTSRTLWKKFMWIPENPLNPPRCVQNGAFYRWTINLSVFWWTNCVMEILPLNYLKYILVFLSWHFLLHILQYLHTGDKKITSQPIYQFSSNR